MIGKPINTDGIKTIPTTDPDPVFKKRNYLYVTPDGKNSSFVRHVYSPLDKKQSYVLIHYIGDHKACMENLI